MNTPIRLIASCALLVAAGFLIGDSAFAKSLPGQSVIPCELILVDTPAPVRRIAEPTLNPRDTSTSINTEAVDAVNSNASETVNPG